MSEESMNEESMNDDELSASEEAQLRSLLGRAADGLSVTVPASASEALESAAATARPAAKPAATPASTPTRWWLGAAAVLVVVVAISGTWWSIGRGGGGGGQVAATADASQGKALAESSVSSGQGARAQDDSSAQQPLQESAREFIVDSEALAPGGIWRLPDGSESLEVTAVSTLPRQGGFQIAVDDVEDPTRWFAVLPQKYWMNAGGRLSPAGTQELEHSMKATVLRPNEKLSVTGSTWIDLEQDGEAENGLTFAYRGVSDDEALAIVRNVAASITNLSDAESVRATLGNLRVPDGLSPTWDPARVGYPSDESAIEAVDFGLRDQLSGAEYWVTLLYSGLSPTVARLEQLLGMDASDLNAAAGSHVPKVQLHPGALAMSSDGAEQLMVFTEDGVAIGVSRSNGAGPPVSRGEQIQVVSSLRPVSEADFRARMRDLGVDIRG
ncbi:MAG TPA: hypothetical protein VL068_00035 [Microthrixaceae bacterium]|nr:hypothetical protein [Microthrixaceae bacterium]